MSQPKSNKMKKSRKGQMDENEVSKLTKEENQVARYLRLKCPALNKQANLNGIKVDYFIGSKLVDCLMESKFGPGTIDPPKDAPFDEKRLLIDRHACFKYAQRLMQKQIFTRAVKVYKEQTDADETPANLRKRKVKEAKETEGNPEATPNKQTPQPEKKEKRKFKLEIHEDQHFVDDAEPYVWTFDPTSTMSSIIGGLLILGSIAICCFPLWPSIVREGVYYLSLAGCGFLGGIIALAVLKYIFFAALYILTLGAIEFWLFPNLTEDVGFVESFIPVYTLKVNSKKEKNTKIEKIESDKIQEDEEPKEVVPPEVVPPEVVPSEVVPQASQCDPLSRSTNDLTTSTVLINRLGDSAENMKKIPEDYDFELVDDEEN